MPYSIFLNFATIYEFIFFLHTFVSLFNEIAHADIKPLPNPAKNNSLII